MKFFANMQGQAFNDDAEILYNILVQYVGISITGSNTVSCHTRSKNGCKCYLDRKGHFNNEAYEETKDSKANAII